MDIPSIIFGLIFAGVFFLLGKMKGKKEAFDKASAIHSRILFEVMNNMSESEKKMFLGALKKTAINLPNNINIQEG